jgi:hypothetical protein
MRLRLPFVVAVLVAALSGAYIGLGLWLGFVTLVDFFSNIFSVVVYAFLTALGTAILLLLTGQWKQQPAESAAGKGKPEPTSQGARLMRSGILLRGVAEPSVREWRSDYSSNLDPRFLHVYAVLFYPKSVSWEKGERTPAHYMPRYKAVVNKKTRKAFYFEEYTLDLLNRRRIRFTTAGWEGEDEFSKYFESRGIKLIREPATQSDLLEGTSALSRILAWLVFLVWRDRLRTPQ